MSKPRLPVRTMHRPWALVLAAWSTSAALAAEAPPAIEHAPPNMTPEVAQLLAQAQAEADRFLVFGEGFDVRAGEAGAERVVKSAPDCADALHETVPWLADGVGGAPNRIVRQLATRLCRDGEGRTRQEVQRAGRKLDYLRDPVAGESWLLDPERKSARRLATGPRSAGDAGAMREYVERVRDYARGVVESVRGARAVAPPVPPVPPTPVVINSSEAGPDGGRTTEVRLIKPRRDGEAADWALPPMPIQWRAQAWTPRGAGNVSPLGSKDFEGVRANGERTSWVIEAGQLGNEKPIQITREVWTAPELMLTVSSRDFDPRSGETSYRPKNLKLGEPDASLMRVPADFSKPARPSARASGPTG